MNIFNRQNLGGMINSAGIRQQDCAAIVYMFRYLDENLEYIVFEHRDDFTIDFKNAERIYAQVKINHIDFSFLRALIGDYYKVGKRNLFIGSSMDDQVRNLIMKKDKYKISQVFKEKDETEKQFEEECSKHKIEFSTFKEIELDIFDTFNCVSIAKNAINEWADKHCVFVDAQRILEELITKIALELRPYGRYLSRKEIIDCISANKTSKIASLNGVRKFDYNKSQVIEDIEVLMKKHKLEYDKLNVVKFEIENDMYLEALNDMIELFESYSDAYKYVYIWLLNMNGQYAECCEIVERDSSSDLKCKFEYLKSLYNLNRFNDAIYIGKGLPQTYDVMLYLGRAYFGNNQSEEAENKFKECIEIDFKRAEAYYDMSQLYGFDDLGLEYLNRAIKLDSDNPLGYLLKGKLKRKKGKYGEAIPCIEQYLSLSEDYNNESVLRELALCCYGAGKEECMIYFSRWLDRFIDHQKIKELQINGKIAIEDNGDINCNYMELRFDASDIIFKINGEDMLKVCNQVYSTGAIGVYVSPYNYFLCNCELMEMMVNGESVSADVKETSKENAASPTLFKIFSDNNTYTMTLSNILNQHVMTLNHSEDNYKEYVVKGSDISVKLIKKKKSLDGIIKIGGYILDIYIPEVGDGYQGFMRKMDEAIPFDEALILLVSPKEITQITFKKSQIKKVER